MSAKLPVDDAASDRAPGTALAVICAVLVLAAGCAADGPRLDPDRSADLAQSAAEASTTPRHELTAEQDLRPRSPRSAAPVADVHAAVANPERPIADQQQDILRKPEEVLSFFGIRRGAAVLDLFSGGGYYTEILAHLVGPDGRVVAHNDAVYRRLAGKEMAERFLPGRLPNVTLLSAESDGLALSAGQFDAAVLIRAYHDLYLPDQRGEPSRERGDALLKAVYAALKPGGVLGVVDHAAAPGTPVAAAASLHRIDPVRLREDIIAAGFVFEAESGVLRNPADDRSLSVFDPAIRGKTDQVVLRFRKSR